MLKADDSAFKELSECLGSVASSRYVEDPFHRMPGSFLPRETGLRFDELKPGDQLAVLSRYVPWEHYKDQGLSDAQAGVIFDNIRDGKPQEKWLEGVFDDAVLENRRIASFKAMVEDSRNSPSNYYFDEMGGDSRPWAELSAAAKLEYISRYAALADAPFALFAQVVKETISDVGEAALRVMLEDRKELHAIAKLFADDGRTEPTPLVERVKDMLDYVSALETQERGRRQGREKLFEGISDVLDGKPPQAWSEAAKLFGEILRNGQPARNEVQQNERGGREISF
jgi:hypothetical protein